MSTLANRPHPRLQGSGTERGDGATWGDGVGKGERKELEDRAVESGEITKNR